MLARRLILDFEGWRLHGVRPFAQFNAKDGRWTWHTSHAAWPFRDGSGDALVEVQAALRWCGENVGGAGAAIGFTGYDAARQIEPRAFNPNSPPDDLQVPDLRLVFCEAIEELRIADCGLRIDTENTAAPQSPASAIAEHYFGAVARIQEDIAAGDIYQANLTQRFEAPLPCSPGDLYDRLRAVHPMPFSALLEWDDLAVVSNSPERFLSLKGRRLLAQPIKGTIRRGATHDEDEQLKLALQHSAKDRAENVMIVDLLRNDLGRVCEWGSVRAPVLCAVQTFPTLHHLVSTVTGTLRPGLDGVDALRAAFPCGSITGAPKIRAMQIIDELESVRRGIAMGAIGYFGFDGDMEWNVAIRTATCQASRAYFHVGGGIVADSTPIAEGNEMLLKAQALRAAVGG